MCNEYVESVVLHTCRIPDIYIVSRNIIDADKELIQNRFC